MNGWVTKNDKEIKARMKEIGEENRALGLEEGRRLGVEEGRTLGLEEGKSIGLEEGKAYAVHNLMSTLSIDFEKACTLLGIAENKEQILALVKELRNGKDTLE